jgi:hypothetical protein
MRPPLDVAAPVRLVDRLYGGLLRDPEVFAQLDGDRPAAYREVLEREAVLRDDLPAFVTAAGSLPIRPLW